ncbi:hypothetical protein GLA29479_228 [Lysobacter antibioticus]|nr:hypothetical protein GLA29479_228 [Lysobacter antibioticus]
MEGLGNFCHGWVPSVSMRSGRGPCPAPVGRRRRRPIGGCALRRSDRPRCT